MGICSSCESISIPAAKLVLQDGQLTEFPSTVKVSYLLQKYPSCFICDSDSMEFDDILSAMHADEELLPDHLYFALPLSRLRYPFQPEEMAALAVKASLALVKSNGLYGHCGRKVQDRTRSTGDENTVVCGIGKKRRRSSCRGSGRHFTSTLTVIQE